MLCVVYHMLRVTRYVIQKLCLIIGDPIKHSLSPKMHNAAYKALGIDNQFAFLASRVALQDTGKAIAAMRVLNIRGTSCTAPHKENVIKYLDKIDKTAKIIGAVNTVVNENNILIGYNTDWIGVIAPLEKITSLKNKKVAIIGAGGAARAAAFGFIEKGASLTIFNRTLAKAKKITHEIGGKAAPLDNIEEIQNYDIIFQSTSFGTKSKSLIPAKFLNKNQIIFDAVYSTTKTKLLIDANKKGAQIIDGKEMLLYQGIEQFKYYTGQDAPENIIREALN